jgi:hypothetical protein
MTNASSKSNKSTVLRFPFFDAVAVAAANLAYRAGLEEAGLHGRDSKTLDEDVEEARANEAEAAAARKAQALALLHFENRQLRATLLEAGKHGRDSKALSQEIERGGHKGVGIMTCRLVFVCICVYT